MKYDTNVLCRRIKEIRISRKKRYLENKEENEKYYCCLTQEDFADAVGVDRRTIIKWENGTSVPSLDYLSSICDLLDCNIEYFLGADELPYIDTIAKASHFTGIDPKIIEYAIRKPDYLNYLNFFMLPENCLEIIDKVTKATWKEYWINESLSDIKPPLIDIIKNAFKDFYSYTHFEEITIDEYKEYLIKYLPKEQINFKSESEKGFLVNIKEVFSTDRYKDCIKQISSDNQYDSFINYLAQLTYNPLINEEFIEIQKQKVAEQFIKIISSYLSDETC